MQDLMIEAEYLGERIVITVEAKVDEPFDNRTIGEYLRSGLATQESGRNSNKAARIEKLLNAIFPKSQHTTVQNLKYQLLPATAGTLAEARKLNATKAIFCVLNFKPEAPSEEYVYKNKQNDKDLNEFMQALSFGIDQAESDLLYGPITVPGDAEIPNDVPLYFLKLEQVFYL